jgi:hypothetical protein
MSEIDFLRVSETAFLEIPETALPQVVVSVLIL